MYIRKVVVRVFGISVDTAPRVKEAELYKPYKQADQKKFSREIPVRDKNSKEHLPEYVTPPNQGSDRSSAPQIVNKRVPPSKHFTLTIDMEQVAGKGEDAPPVLLQFQDNSFVLGVADGMGGAGGTTYEVDEGKRSGAYLASRVVNRIAEQYFQNFIEQGSSVVSANPKELTAELKHHIDVGLSQVLEQIDRGGNVRLKIKSSMIKRLPTTMALCYAKPHASRIDICCFWAGDSRVYCMDPTSGLHQLTPDDLKSKGDAYENLYDDSPISNCINADSDYKINMRHVEVNAPQIIFAATDGAFGHLPSPIHFEYLLLDALIDASSMDDWKKQIQKRYAGTQADDITYSVALIGINDFATIKALFSRRHTMLRREIESAQGSLHQMSETELALKEAEEKNQSLLDSLTQFEIELDEARRAHQEIEKRSSNLDSDEKKIAERIAFLKKELEQLEVNLKSVGDEKIKIGDDIEQAAQAVEGARTKLEDFKKANDFIDTKPLADRLQKQKEQRGSIYKGLWLKHKAEYEKHLK